MRALMLGEINQLCRLANAANGRFSNDFTVAYDGDDAAVVIGVHLAVQKRDARNLHGVDDSVNDCFVTAFREIRYAFNQCGHAFENIGFTAEGAKDAEVLLSFNPES